jgi:hypothetical protein
MDFSKMRSKLHSGEYKKVSDLRVDFQLMMDNCALFNKDNMYFWRYGHQMRSLGLKVLKSAEQDEQVSSSVSYKELIGRLKYEQIFLTKKFMQHLKIYFYQS